MFTAGLHVPLTPLLDVVGSDKDAPEQIAAICVNAGASVGETTMVMLLLVVLIAEAHTALLVRIQEMFAPFDKVDVV